jgi:prepilin-type N-terminal cleavage/methylation domain-containing protein
MIEYKSIISQPKQDEGFTLIELVVALMILCITITPMIGMFTWSSNVYHRLDSNITALTIAMDIIDRIKAGDIDGSNLQHRIDDYKNEYDVEIEVEILRLQDRPDGMRVRVQPCVGQGWVVLSTYVDGISTN